MGIAAYYQARSPWQAASDRCVFLANMERKHMEQDDIFFSYSDKTAGDRCSGRLAPVGLIAPFPDLAGLGYEVLQEFPYPVEIRVGDMAKGLAEARSLHRQGVEVLISRGGTANLIREKIGTPVVDVRTSAYDVLVALKPYINLRKRIGLLGTEAMFLGAQQRMRQLFDMDITIYPFTDISQVSAQIRRAVEDGIEVVIGGRQSVRMAREAGTEGVLLSSGREAVLTAFHEAYHMLDIFQAESARLARQHTVETRFDAILNAVREPIWILDPQGAVQLSNAAAAALMGGTGFGGLLPLHPSELLHTICTTHEPLENMVVRLGGKPLLLDSMPLETDKPSILIMGRSVSKIEQSERTLRSAFYSKGHVARYRFTDILGQDSGFLSVIERARSYAPSSSTVLVIGETGTGKELLAQSMHNACFSDDRPFVAVNCATLPENLLESELFGYARGAFTGARQEGRKGLFELAHGGSILLDEIGEMPLPLQSRLLRVLEERAVRPVGDDRIVPVDVRLMATTNVNLEEAVAAGRFRRDLFYRLNVLSLMLPPLRKRGEDPLHIFRIFIRQRNPQVDIDRLLDHSCREMLLDYDWPGNLRELRNLVEKLYTLTFGFTRDQESIATLLCDELSRAEHRTGFRKEEPEDVLEQLVREKAIKQRYLAELLGVSRTTMWRRSKTR